MNCSPPHFEVGTKGDISFQGKKKFLKYLGSSAQKAYRALQIQQYWSHDPTATTYGFILEESPASDTAPERGNSRKTLTFLNNYTIFVMNKTILLMSELSFDTKSTELGYNNCKELINSHQPNTSLINII